MASSARRCVSSSTCLRRAFGSWAARLPDTHQAHARCAREQSARSRSTTLGQGNTHQQGERTMTTDVETIIKQLNDLSVQDLVNLCRSLHERSRVSAAVTAP